MSKKSFRELRERIIEKPPFETLIWLAWPMIIANLINISYNLIDAYWLGKMGSEAVQAFSAPTVSWPLIMLFYSIGMGYSFAGVSLVSQYIGANNLEKANRTAGNMLFFMLVMSITISIVGYLFSPLVFMYMGIPLDVYPYAVNYIRVIFMGIPFSFIGFAFMFIANSLGDTRTPTLISAVSSIINIFLDPIFIFGFSIIPRMGVIGAALATILSRSLISIIGVYLLSHGYRGIKIGLKDLRIESWWLSKVFKIGTPMVIQQSANSLGFVVMTSIVSSFGSAVIAAYGVAIRIVDVIQAFTWGLQRATAIMIGQNIGAGKYDRARVIASVSLKTIASVLGAGALVIYLTRSWTIAVFISKTDVIAIGDALLSIFTWSIPFFGVFFVGNGIAAGSGHTLYMSILGIIRLWLLRIGLSYLLGIVWGLGSDGVWIGMTVSNIVAGLGALIWIIHGKWAEKVIE